MAPPVYTITEADVPSQSGRVFLVTGGTAGIGLELAKSLYHVGATVWITGRSASRCEAAVSAIKSAPPPPGISPEVKPGELRCFTLDLADLSTVKASVQEHFLPKVERLDVVFHNAGIMTPPDDSLSAQGHEAQLATNVLGPFLLQTFLTPLMMETAKREDVAPGQTRVVWVSSLAHSQAPAPDGVNWADPDLNGKRGLAARFEKYGQSKAMAILLAEEFAARYGEGNEGIVSLSVHPGRLKTNLQSDQPRWLVWLFGFGRQDPRYGGLTEFFAGFCNVGEGNGDNRNGGYIVPWGRFAPGDVRKDIREGIKERATGKRCWELCEGFVNAYT